MHPLGERFGSLHRETVQVERLGVFAARLQLLEAARGRVAHRHHLEGGDVHIARLRAAEVVGETETLASLLTREVEARDLPQRSAVAPVRRRVVDDELVAARLYGEESVHRARREPAIAPRFGAQALERRTEFLTHHALELL